MLLWLNTKCPDLRTDFAHLRLHGKIVSGTKAYVVKWGKNSYDRNSMLRFFDTATYLTMTGIVWCRLGAPPVWREAWLWYPTNTLSLLIWSQKIFLYLGSQESWNCFCEVFLFVLFCFWTRSVVVFQKLWDVCCWASFMKITRLPNVVCQACQLARHNGCQRSFASCIACKYIRGWKLWAFQGPQLTCCIVLRKVERWNTQVKEFFDFLFCGLPMGTAV